MEAKKNRGKDVHRLSGVFFQVGLIVSTAIVIVVFEWTTELKKPKLKLEDNPGMEMVYIPVTNPTEPVPPSPFTSKPITTSKIPILTTELTTTSEESAEENQLLIEVSQLYIPPVIVEVEPPDSYTDIVSFPEKNAEPIGGYSSFYKLMNDNLKYPKNAIRFNVEGRVFVEFIVNKDGSVVDLKVIKGIGAGCDEEAVRVVGLSKWNPGLQRGRPVRVKMVIPVVFKLN